MAYCRLIVVLCIIDILIGTLSDAQNIHKKPVIHADSEIVINAGDNYTIFCEGSTPLHWGIPEVNDEEYKIYTKIRIFEVEPSDRNSFNYGSQLIIENASFPFTGFYSCHDQHKGKLGLAKTYLYIRDEEHLSVNERELDTVLATQYEEAVIPCRPTSPDVNVELLLISGEKITEAKFNPKTGFKLFVTSLSDEGHYICAFERGSNTFEIFVYVKVLPLIDSLPKPLITESNQGHTVVGDMVVLHCEIRTHAQVSIEWKTPKGPVDRKRMQTSSLRRDPKDEVIIYENLTIGETRLTDNGIYYCIFHDNQNHSTNSSINVKIYDINEHFLNLTEENGVYNVSAMAGTDSVQWKIDVAGHPIPKLSWLNNKNEIITLMDAMKYEIAFTSTEAFLKVKNIDINDYGVYTLIAENAHENKSLEVFLNVTDRPSVRLEIDDFQMINQIAKIKCNVAAHPKAAISLQRKLCQGEECPYEEIKNVSVKTDGNQLVTSSAHFKVNQSGYVKCYAKNIIGEDEDIRELLVSDVRNGFDIFGFDPSINLNWNTNEAVIAVGETLKMICGVSVYNYTDQVNWIVNGRAVDLNEERYTLERVRTTYSHRQSLTLSQIKLRDQGLYSCQVRKLNGLKITKNITIIVRNAVSPVINKTNLIPQMEMKLPKPLQIYCESSGIPKPTIRWLKNGEELSEDGHMKFVKDRQQVLFLYTEPKDEGVYKCEVSNKLGRATREMNLKFTNAPAQLNKWLIIIIAGLTIIVLIGLILIISFVRNKNKLKRELKIAGLQNFEKGAVENINPDLGIDDQAELLPYDKKWEFPIEKLKLGKQLGSGAFGVVMKGVAKGILDEESSTTVAVKMVKRNADNIYIKALASELKIMVHLGKHLNVVNLLGACTKNVAKKELLVIVEYCRFGNLQNYLLRHRDNFIDQVDHKTGLIDFTIGLDILERTYSISSNRSNPQSPYLKYAALTFKKSESDVPIDMGDYRGNNYSGATTNTDTTIINTGDDGVVLSNNSVQPEWRSNYRGDYKGNVRPICTKDLLAWAFQVARGMEYLASRRVLHGDLAARNILLADNNVVKICDFGLAKSMYKNDNYKKKGDGPLPVKWMAIESIRDRVFSTQSDVWSYGIVLWEFFSLARTPYPGMEADERLYNKLLEGYRMESPEYSPKEIYKLMLDCWNSKPTLRPSFTKIAERIGSMLEDSVRKYYIDLNDPYLVMNTQRIEDDYLAMLSPPNFENLSSPSHDYVNKHKDPEDIDGYLCMKPSIFSPRVEDDRIFDFSAATKNKRNDESPVNESIPMLTASDSESACNSPNPASVSNPSYHLLVGNNIAQDNYVNMPKSKADDSISSNPFNTERVKDAKINVHYVNSEPHRNWGSVNG